MSHWVDIAKSEDLLPGKWIAKEIGPHSILLANINGVFYAIENVCTHEEARLSDGELEQDEIVCPRHGAHFCLRDGAAMSPPAYDPVTTFPTRVENGIVQVNIEI